MDRDLKFQVNFMVSVILSLAFLHMSEANDCTDRPTQCPDYLGHQCYCPDGSEVKFTCENGQWRALPCDLPTTQATTAGLFPVPTCPDPPKVLFATLKYYPPSHSRSGYLHGTIATYECNGTSTSQVECRNGYWIGKIPTNMCSCNPPPSEEGWQTISSEPGSKDNKSGRYKLHSTVKYFCKTGDKELAKFTCVGNDQWNRVGDLHDPNACASQEQKSTIVIHKPQKEQKSTIVIHKPQKATESSIHHTEERTVVIVSGTTGAILGALIILVVIVSCQRRLHYHRMRRARLRHRQDQDAFTAFITYHRDVRLMLPSYDEAINQQQHGRPPSYEEPTLPPEDTPAGEDPPSISTDSPTSSVSAASDTRSSPENNCDTGPLIDGQSSVSPTSEDSRFLRSLRTLFGGRPFRPDAIYCRFVPDENGGESSARTEERVSRNNSNTVDDLTEVLAQAGLY